MRRVLVTGATGFIGYELSRQLAELVTRPRLMVRRPERAPLLRPLNAELVAGDLRRETSLKRAVAGVDTVFHLGARAAFESYARLRPTIVDGTRLLARAARDAGVERFVFASSLLVYGGQSEPIDAATPASPRVDYGRAKVEAESALREEIEGSDVRLAIVRLPHVYGARDLLFERVRAGRVILVGRGRNRYAHLHVVDSARLLIELARRGWQGTSPVADDHPATWEEYFAILAEHYPRFRTWRVPSGLAHAGARILGALQNLRARPNLYTADTVTGWNLELPVKRGILWDELGLAPRYPTVHEGLPAALDDCIAFRWLHPLADGAHY